MCGSLGSSIISQSIGILIRRRWKIASRKVKREIGMEEELSIDDYKAEIKGSFVEGTSHLKKSRDNGHDSRSRTYKNMKLLLAAAILGGIFWYLFM